MVKKKEDCWMSFSEALDQYMRARTEMGHFGTGGINWTNAKERLDEAKDHMDALTDSMELRSH